MFKPSLVIAFLAGMALSPAYAAPCRKKGPLEGEGLTSPKRASGLKPPGRHFASFPPIIAKPPQLGVGKFSSGRPSSRQCIA